MTDTPKKPGPAAELEASADRHGRAKTGSTATNGFWVHDGGGPARYVPPEITAPAEPTETSPEKPGPKG